MSYYFFHSLFNSIIIFTGERMKKLKKEYLFLFIIIIVGILSGIIFTNILNVNDKKIVYTRITTYFNNLSNDVALDYRNNLLHNIKNNGIYILLIISFSLSIIGLFFNTFILFLKSFILGFTIGSIINIYFYSGIVLAIFYVFPAQLFSLLMYAIIIFHANTLSLKLFEYIFKKKECHFSLLLKKNMRIIGLVLFLHLLSDLFDIFLTPYILKLFCFLIT